MHMITHYHLVFFFGGGYPACSSSHDHDHDDNDVVSDDHDDDDPSWSRQTLAFDRNISNNLLPQKKLNTLYRSQVLSGIGFI